MRLYTKRKWVQPKGEKYYAGKDCHARGRVNAIGAITNFKLFNICLFSCNIEADNAAFHKRNNALLKEVILCYFFHLMNPSKKNGYKQKA